MEFNTNKEVMKMNCFVCQSRMKRSVSILTFKIDSNRILVIKDVPALICEQCGEESIDLQTSKNVEKQVNKAVSDGIRMGFIDYNSAA